MKRHVSSRGKRALTASFPAFAAAGVLILSLVACRGGTGSETAAPAPTSTPSPSPTLTPTATPEPAPTNTPTSTPSPTIPYSLNFSLPPGATLTSRAGAQVAAIGSFCWTGEDGRGGCVDMIGIPAPEVALSVDGGERLDFSVEGFERFAHVAVEVYDYSRTKLDGSRRLILYPSPEHLAVPFDADGGAVALTAELRPGEYVVAISVWFPLESAAAPAPGTADTAARGGAVYGFHIEVADEGI